MRAFWIEPRKKPESTLFSSLTPGKLDLLYEAFDAGEKKTKLIKMGPKSLMVNSNPLEEDKHSNPKFSSVNRQCNLCENIIKRFEAMLLLECGHDSHAKCLIDRDNDEFLYLKCKQCRCKIAIEERIKADEMLNAK